MCNVYLASLWYILSGHISSSITVTALSVSLSEYFMLCWIYWESQVLWSTPILLTLLCVFSLFTVSVCLLANKGGHVGLKLLQIMAQHSIMRSLCHTPCQRYPDLLAVKSSIILNVLLETCNCMLDLSFLLQ